MGDIMMLMPHRRIPELLAPAGNLIVDTTGTDSVEVEVSSSKVVLNQTCGRDLVTVTSTMSGVTGALIASL